MQRKKEKDTLERIEFKTRLKTKFKSKCIKNNKTMTEVLEEKILEYLLEEESKNEQ